MHASDGITLRTPLYKQILLAINANKRFPEKQSFGSKERAYQILMQPLYLQA
jgi:hypothetical protein